MTSSHLHVSSRFAWMLVSVRRNCAAYATCACLLTCTFLIGERFASADCGTRIAAKESAAAKPIDAASRSTRDRLTCTLPPLKTCATTALGPIQEPARAAADFVTKQSAR